MKTCTPHNYNPPSRCPNCRIHKRRKQKQAAQKGWQTRRNQHQNTNEKNETFEKHGWLS